MVETNFKNGLSNDLKITNKNGLVYQ